MGEKRDPGVGNSTWRLGRESMKSRGTKWCGYSIEMVENGARKVNESQEIQGFVDYGKDLGLHPERNGEPVRF